MPDRGKGALNGVRRSDVNRPGFTGGQNSRRIARYGTESKEDLEAIFTCYPVGHVYMPVRASSANVRSGWLWSTAMIIRANLRR